MNPLTLDEQIKQEIEIAQGKVNEILLSLDFMTIDQSNSEKLKKQLQAVKDLNQRLSGCFES